MSSTASSVKANASAIVSFYLDNISEVNLIDRQIGIQVLQYGFTIVTANWTTNIIGNHTIIVDVTNVDPRDLNVQNNTAQKNITIDIIPTFDISLTPGWNLISLPLEQNNTTISNVLSSVDGQYNAVKYYDATDANDPWKTYRPGASTNDLFDIDHTMGFWINMNDCNDSTLESCESRLSVFCCLGIRMI